jgi:iron-sulfur cluster assembly accessory protein
MTESTGAYRPETLDPGPPPPRNIGVPETSIAGGLKSDRDADAEKRSTMEGQYALQEQEAQRPRPATEALDPTMPNANRTKTTRPPGKSRLRPRKAAMSLTPRAVMHVRELLDQPEPKLIRVGVKNKGCSGSSYHLEYVDKPGTFDELVEQDGVKVLIDSKALIKVIGSEMDWVEDKLSARFTFKNPNISEYIVIVPVLIY